MTPCLFLKTWDDIQLRKSKDKTKLCSLSKSTENKKLNCLLLLRLSIMFILKIEKNKENNQHCLKPLAG